MQHSRHGKATVLQNTLPFHYYHKYEDARRATPAPTCVSMSACALRYSALTLAGSAASTLSQFFTTSRQLP